MRRIVNRNRLVRSVPAVSGVKTGHTQQAGYVLVGAAQRDGVRVVSAVLGEPSEAARDADSLELLRYGLGRYRSVPALRRDQALARPKLKYRDDQSVSLVAARSVDAVVRRGQRPTVRTVGVPSELDGPLRQRARVATAVVEVGGRTVARVPLVTSRPVSEASLGERAGNFFGSGLTLLLVAVLAISTLQLALLRRRAHRRRARSRGRRGTETA